MNLVADVAFRSYADVKWHLMTAELRRVSATPASKATVSLGAGQHLLPLLMSPIRACSGPPAIGVAGIWPAEGRRHARRASFAAWRRASGAAWTKALAASAWFIATSAPIVGAI